MLVVFSGYSSWCIVPLENAQNTNNIEQRAANSHFDLQIVMTSAILALSGFGCGGRCVQLAPHCTPNIVKYDTFGIPGSPDTIKQTLLAPWAPLGAPEDVRYNICGTFGAPDGVKYNTLDTSGAPTP